ncbi:MAG: hypothetical protein O2960_17625 [Verrucomicrobia bacterium]|nr:hypothetical protein [Verrucomicrobiota bacterium]
MTRFTGARRVIAVDTNLLAYSHREDSEFNAAARELIEALGFLDALFGGGK